MRARTLAELGWMGLATMLRIRRSPIVGSLIVTDRCNLNCAHCAVGNIRRVDYPFAQLQADMRSLHASGVRILFLYGGEPFLWRDGQRALADLVEEARRFGFLLVNVVTNGTRGLDLPGADLILVSLDGTREDHDRIRGRTYDRILANIQDAPRDNLCLYMAINRLNVDDIEDVCATAVRLDNVRGVAFNLHTPYPGTEHLSLTREQRRSCVDRITRLKARGYPVLDLVSALPAVLQGATAPCPQCVVMEDGQTWVCGRCIDIPGLCQDCGFLFAAELAQLFSGRPTVVMEAVRTYARFV